MLFVELQKRIKSSQLAAGSRSTIILCNSEARTVCQMHPYLGVQCLNSASPTKVDSVIAEEAESQPTSQGTYNDTATGVPSIATVISNCTSYFPSSHQLTTSTMAAFNSNSGSYTFPAPSTLTSTTYSANGYTSPSSSAFQFLNPTHSSHPIQMCAPTVYSSSSPNWQHSIPSTMPWVSSVPSNKPSFTFTATPTEILLPQTSSAKPR